MVIRPAAYSKKPTRVSKQANGSWQADIDDSEGELDLPGQAASMTAVGTERCHSRNFHPRGFLVEDLASIVEPNIFIVDDVALPPPITFLVLPGEKAVAAKLAGGGLGLASGDPRVGRLSETGSDNDDSEGQSGDERLHDTSPSIAHQRGRARAPNSI